MRKAAAGPYVRYTDHLAALAAVEARVKDLQATNHRLMAELADKIQAGLAVVKRNAALAVVEARLEQATAEARKYLSCADPSIYELVDAIRQLAQAKMTAMENNVALTAERDALREQVANFKESLADMVNQFAYESTKDGVPTLMTGGLSALEDAFERLGYTDPHPVPWRACEYPGCHEHAHCGTPMPDGYKRCCGEHFSVYQKLKATPSAGQEEA